MSWTASVIISKGSTKQENSALLGDHFHIQVRVYDASSKEEALEGTETVAMLLASGKKAVFRALPESDSYTDFDTKETIHQGYARFTLIDISGGWVKAEHEVVKVPF